MTHEVGAAVSILFPAGVSAFYAYTAPRNVQLAAFGCMLHCPFSVALHVHKSVSTNAVRRTLLYKLDASFIHVHGLISSYAWFMRPNALDVFYHSACILYILFSDPLSNPKTKTIIDLSVAVGVVKSNFNMFYKDRRLWLLAHVLWLFAFMVHAKKLVGVHSSWLMHLLIVFPQWLVLYTMNTR